MQAGAAWPGPLLGLLVLAACGGSDAAPPVSGAGGVAGGSGGRPTVVLDAGGSSGGGAGDAGAGDGAGEDGPDGDGRDALHDTTSDGSNDGSGDSSDDGAAATARVICGAQKAVLPTDVTVEALVVTPEGTIYYSTGVGVSRIRPGLPHEPFGRFSPGHTYGITYDPKHRVLYVGNRGRIEIAALAVDFPTSAPRAFRVSGGGVYGLTLGDDGAVYYTDEYDGSVYRMTPEGATTQVATGIPKRPRALAFGPDGALYLSETVGRDIWRITLDASGKEAKREIFATAGGNGNSGLAFDHDGRLYVTAGNQLEQFDRNGTRLTTTTMPRYSSQLDFGAGMLSCSDLYVGGLNHFEVITLHTRGMDVPWHRSAPAP